MIAWINSKDHTAYVVRPEDPKDPAAWKKFRYHLICALQLRFSDVYTILDVSELEVPVDDIDLIAVPLHWDATNLLVCELSVKPPNMTWQEWVNIINVTRVALVYPGQQDKLRIFDTRNKTEVAYEIPEDTASARPYNVAKLDD